MYFKADENSDKKPTYSFFVLITYMAWIVNVCFQKLLSLALLASKWFIFV